MSKRSTSETGHAKNIANFGKLIQNCEQLGAIYNPSASDIKLPNLKAVHTAAKEAVAKDISASADFQVATNRREIAFKPLRALCTRIINAFKACKPASQTIDDAVSIVAKIQGYSRKTTSTVTAPEETTPATSDAPQSNSTSQQSFDMRIHNLAKLIESLVKEPKYAPNEEELKTATITAFYTQLEAENKAGNEATIIRDSAKAERNKILYAENTGLLDLAYAVKAYVRSLSGVPASIAKEVSSIAFKRY